MHDLSVDKWRKLFPHFVPQHDPTSQKIIFSQFKRDAPFRVLPNEKLQKYIQSVRIHSVHFLRCSDTNTDFVVFALWRKRRSGFSGPKCVLYRGNWVFCI